MLTEEQIANLYYTSGYGSTEYDGGALQFARAIEQAVRKEMEGDVKDAERYRWLRDKTEWEPFDSSWLCKVDLYGGEASDMDAFFDAARGQT